jgi:predicted ATPase/DNA-binding CsgD family transcriptional regulator
VATTDSDHGEQTGPVAAVGAAKASEVTAREAEVLTLLTRHLTNVEIADALSISVRTVESHVSALLRKLHYRDRRSLARHADQPAGAPERSALHSWPSAVTPLIGRSAERAALASAIAEHPMVTVTGPGGVGKTRLTLSVAAEIARERRDGAWFVDLVKVTDPATVVAAIADTIGVPEQRSISIESALVASLGERDGLLVIDNCEHLLDGVRHCVERILGSCPNVTVLATSRSRLLVPYEWVYEVPGLSVSEDGGDAVDLFTARVAATGEPALPDPRRVAALCRALDGMALAIELAAARYSTLGLDGLEGALDERLRFLIGGTRIADRHRSLRDAIDWSYELLEPEDRVLLNDVSVLASWFDVEAARAVSRPNAERATVADGLARLATDSLLVVQRGEPTRYRALETIRQYGIEQLAAAGELGAIRARHEQWCRAEMTTLRSAAPDDAWCARFDRVVDDIRAALLWSAADERRRSESASLAADLAALLFVRGRPAETQRRYEQAAELTPIDALRATYLRLAAGAAASRYVGNEALRLLGAAADLATTLGDGAAAAHDLAWMAIYIIRAPGIMVDKPTVDEAAERCDSARAMSDGSLRAEAAIATAAACCGRSDPAVLDWSRTAVDLAHRSADPITESAALDQLCAVQLERDDIPKTVGLIRERGRVIERLDVDASSGFEYLDFYLMASEVNIAAGDLAASRRYADAQARLPFFRDQEHLAFARRLKVDALAGNFDDVVSNGERFRVSWEETGRPVASDLAGASYAVAMVHGILGDDDERAAWLRMTVELGSAPERLAGCATGWAPTFDALVALHRDDVATAVARLSADIDDPQLRFWHTMLWRPWYAALWVEAAVLGQHRDAHERIERGHHAARDNPIASAIVDRAAALLAGDDDTLSDSAGTFSRLGCPYQATRSTALMARVQ